MRSTIRSWIRAGGIAVTLLVTPAMSAPYCIELQGITSQCLYVDANSCRLRAQQLGGSCSVNPAEITLPSVGAFPYCISGPGYASCKFADRGSCEAEASRVGASCVESFAAAAASAPPDPYRDLFVTGR